LLDEEDIDFKSLSGSTFEELTFDLLQRLGFHSQVWRQGGADQGRDIESVFNPCNPLVASYREKWFIECKNLASGVGVEEISTKIAWADAEKPDHFAIVTSSYLTSSCREWLEKIEASKTYRIHVLEGKALKTLLLGFPDLVQRYLRTSTIGYLRTLFGNGIFWDYSQAQNSYLYFIRSSTFFTWN
jgi:hypothetical protein